MTEQDTAARLAAKVRSRTGRDNPAQRGPLERPSSVDEFIHMGRRQPRLLIPAMPERLGVSLFATKLEHEHYRPGTPANEDFQVMDFKIWMGARWLIFSVPRADRPMIEQVCRETGMRLANGEPHALQTGIVVAFGSYRAGSARARLIAEEHAARPGGRITPFPVRGEHVWTLENDHDSPEWKARHTHPAEAREAELRMMEAILDRHYADLPFELGPDQAWIRCRACGLTSHNPDDVAARYCANCHTYHLPLGRNQP